MRKAKKKNEIVALVKVLDDVLVVSTLDMCGPLGVEHQAIMKLVRKYENYLQEIRTVGFEIRQSGGNPITFCYLDEEQAAFLVTLMKNSDAVVSFKHKMTREFYRMRKEIIRLQAIVASNRSNLEWSAARATGKPIRLGTTDVIKTLIEYATEQGSKNANMSYINYTKMANSALFDIKNKKIGNIRDACDADQLGTLKVIDKVIAKAIEEDMAQGTQYSKIFQNVKEKVQQFSQFIGKSCIPGSVQQIGM